MNWYYSSLEYLVFTKIKDEVLSPYYSLISVSSLIGEKNDVVNPGNYEYYHEGSFNYGIKVYYIDAPDYPQEL
jgi:hypothetical protein